MGKVAATMRGWVNPRGGAAISAVRWMVFVEVPEIAAASSSESIDLAVPGSPTS